MNLIDDIAKGAVTAAKEAVLFPVKVVEAIAEELDPDDD